MIPQSTTKRKWITRKYLKILPWLRILNFIEEAGYPAGWRIPER
jgi:hypothetical protein